MAEAYGLWLKSSTKSGWEPLTEQVCAPLEAHLAACSSAPATPSSVVVPVAAGTALFDVALNEVRWPTGEFSALSRFVLPAGVSWELSAGKGKPFHPLGRYAAAVLEFARHRRARSIALHKDDTEVTVKAEGALFKVDTVQLTCAGSAGARVRRAQSSAPEPAAAAADATLPASPKRARADIAAIPPAMPVKTSRLVFPSISTAIFMFDVTLAAQVGANAARAFLKAHPPASHPLLHISLIDFSPTGGETETLAAFRAAWAKVNVEADPRFTFVAGDVANAAQRGPAKYIVNATNATFNGGPSTGGINRAIHVAAGPGLQADSRAKYPKGATVGPCYEVALRPDSPLYAEGVRYVLHCLGPNFNPARPNALPVDQMATKGAALLRSVYDNMLATYAALVAKE